MLGETGLRTLLASMEPVLQPGVYVFTTVDAVPPTCDPIATVREAEGTTLVLAQPDADVHDLAYEFEAAMITLMVDSALEAVGLTAAVARQLADEGISCNVVAGYYHDHLFVPADRAEDAMAALLALVAGAASHVG